MGIPDECGAKRPSPYIKYVRQNQEIDTTTSTTTTLPPYNDLLEYINIPESGLIYSGPINRDDVLLDRIDPLIWMPSGCESFSYTKSDLSADPPFYVSYRPCSYLSNRIYREISRRPLYFDNNSIPVSICASGYQPYLFDLEDVYSEQTKVGYCGPVDYNTLQNIDSHKTRTLIENECIDDFLETGKKGHSWKVKFEVTYYKNFHQQNPKSNRYIYQWDYYEIDGSLSPNEVCITYDNQQYSNIDQNSPNWKRIATTASNYIVLTDEGFGIPVYSYRIKSPESGEQDTDGNLKHTLYAIRCIVHRNIYTQEPQPFLLVTNFFTDDILCECLKEGYYCWVDNDDPQDKGCSNLDLRPLYSIVSGPFDTLSECDTECQVDPPDTTPPVYPTY